MDDGVSCCQRKMHRNGHVRFTLTSSRVIPSSLASSICPLFPYINLGGEKVRLKFEQHVTLVIPTRHF